MQQKTALITGVTGQDGSYLARDLLANGYRVVGMRQPVAFDDTKRLSYILPDWQSHHDFYLVHGDMTDGGSLYHLMTTYDPDEVYNLAGQAHVQASFAAPELSANVNALGVLRLLEILRTRQGQKQVRFLQASTSELFGNEPAPQSEKTPMSPRSPYAIAKHYAYQMTKMYREAYGVFAANAIMFNHESPVRGEDFVTQKIIRAVCRMQNDPAYILELGNLDARRDWSHAADIMRGVRAIMAQPIADDFVLASGQSYSVREFVTAAFDVVGQKIIWGGQGIDEIGRDQKSGKVLVKVAPQFFRPLEVDNLCGDASKAQRILNWTPQYSFEALVNEMMMCTMDGRYNDIDTLAA